MLKWQFTLKRKACPSQEENTFQLEGEPPSEIILQIKSKGLQTVLKLLSEKFGQKFVEAYRDRSIVA